MAVFTDMIVTGGCEGGYETAQRQTSSGQLSVRGQSLWEQGYRAEHVITVFFRCLHTQSFLVTVSEADSQTAEALTRH